MEKVKRYKLIFSPEALSDMQEARNWYNLQQKGLGKKLITAIKKVTMAINGNPYHASIQFEHIRTVACKTFPYSIHYEIDEPARLVRIISIFHFSRKPYWVAE